MTPRHSNRRHSRKTAGRRKATGPRTHGQPEIDNLPLDPDRWRYILDLLLARHNWRHSVRNKGVSNKTMDERGRFCVWLFKFLRNDPKEYKLDPRSFSGKHIDCVMAHWQQEAKAGRMQPATIAVYASFLRTFTGWIGKPKLMKPLRCYFDDPRLYQRSLVAKTDKSWRARGVDVLKVIGEVEAYDVHCAASLWLMHAFDLRFKESVMTRPHTDVISAAQAGKAEDGVASYLDIHRGTKGGRMRLLPIDSALRQHAIDYARRVTIGVNDSVSDPRLSLQQAIRRLRYVMERFGITRADLGVTPHGLRHQGAADRFQKVTQVPPPVAGGPAVDPALDLQARREIADHLGHVRVQITNCYLGARRVTPANGSPPCTGTDTDVQHATGIQQGRTP